MLVFECFNLSQCTTTTSAHQPTITTNDTGWVRVLLPSISSQGMFVIHKAYQCVLITIYRQHIDTYPRCHPPRKCVFAHVLTISQTTYDGMAQDPTKTREGICKVCPLFCIFTSPTDNHTKSTISTRWTTTTTCPTSQRRGGAAPSYHIENSPSM